jgi:hypothetical protein
LTIEGPPTRLLAAAAGVAVVGGIVGGVACGQGYALIGWALAGPVAIGVLAFFVLTDTKRRTAPTYVQPPGMARLYFGAAAVVAIAIIVSAIGAAYWVGRF